MEQTLITAGSVITDFRQDAQQDTAVLVVDGRVAEIGAATDLLNRYPRAKRFGSPSFLLMPAMVNSHDHGRALGTAPLGVSDSFLEVWIPGLWAQPSIDPYLAALYDGLRLLRSGVGTVVHYHNPRDWKNLQVEADATLRGYRDAGIRTIFCPPFLDQNQLVYIAAGQFIESLPSEMRESAMAFAMSHPYSLEEYFEICEYLLSAWRDTENWMSDVQVNPVGGQWVSDDALTKLTSFALHCDMRVQMHLLETIYQRQYAFKTWGKGFVQHLDELGVLGPWLTCAHMVWVEEADLPLLAQRGVGIVSNTSSNLRLRSGTAALAKMVAAGLDIGLGLDGHGLDDDQDFLRETRMAWFLANRPGMDSETISARQAAEMATSGGGRVSWGAKVSVGSLHPGAMADLVLVDLQALQGAWYAPQVDVAEMLLQRGRCEHISDVMINGKWVYKDSKSCTIAISEVETEIAKSVQSQPESSMAQSAAQLEPYIRKYYSGWV